MGIVDELDTPGCPQCAVKHLCAALSYAADGNRGDEQTADEFVLAARALVNLAEADMGYRSHRDFAVGLLERAERAACLAAPGGLDFAGKARALRLAVISGSSEETYARRELDAAVHPSSYMWAHLVEAGRELPGMYIPTCDPSVKAIQALLERVREEYFSLPEVTVAEGEETPKEKEPEMATAKKKKAPVKAAKAAKVAKCAKCACKGGKTKKGK